MITSLQLSERIPGHSDTIVGYFQVFYGQWRTRRQPPESGRIQRRATSDFKEFPGNSCATR
jgi:hypothetical protein